MASLVEPWIPKVRGVTVSIAFRYDDGSIVKESFEMNSDMAYSIGYDIQQMYAIGSMKAEQMYLPSGNIRIEGSFLASSGEEAKSRKKIAKKSKPKARPKKGKK